MSVFVTVPLLAAGCSSGSTGHHAAPASGAASSASSASAQPGAGGVQQITINATNDFRFDPATIHSRVGTLRVTLVDTGSYPHNLAVASLHSTSKTVSGQPGATSTTYMLTFAHPGTYSFVCTYHSSAGMKGQFVVTP